MKIIYWADFNCPFSYIGNSRLKHAIEELGLDVEMEMKAYELEPDESEISDIPMRNYYARKHGIPEFEADKSIDEINNLAISEGLNFNYKGAHITLTRNAHRLVKLAMKKDSKAAENIIEKLFHANFCENKRLNDDSVITEIGRSEGLNEKQIKEMLDSNSYTTEVLIDEEDAYINGISATPHYIFVKNEDILIIPGALTKEEFKIALEDFTTGKIESKTYSYENVIKH